MVVLQFLFDRNCIKIAKLAEREVSATEKTHLETHGPCLFVQDKPQTGQLYRFGATDRTPVMLANLHNKNHVTRYPATQTG
jgi:hypothetical protein